MNQKKNSTAEADLILAVENSVTGRVWTARSAEHRIVQAIAQNHDLPEIVARVIAGRGIGIDDADIFLNPTLKETLPDPSHFKDMDKACARIADAITDGEKVAVFGDYDVDGATSSAIFKRFFKALGQDITAYIPDRMTEGYGPNTKALLELKAAGHQLVITVDCGIVSFEPLSAATYDSIFSSLEETSDVPCSIARSELSSRRADPAFKALLYSIISVYKISV